MKVGTLQELDSFQEIPAFAALRSICCVHVSYPKVLNGLRSNLASESCTKYRRVNLA
jgi:hypothetical protein